MGEAGQGNRCTRLLGNGAPAHCLLWAAVCSRALLVQLAAPYHLVTADHPMCIKS